MMSSGPYLAFDDRYLGHPLNSAFDQKHNKATMPSIAPNTISPQQGGYVPPFPSPLPRNLLTKPRLDSIAGTTVGNVPGSANVGLGSGEAPDLTPTQSVVGDPAVLEGSKIEPLDKEAGAGMSPCLSGRARGC